MLLQDERAKGFASAKLERRAEHDPEKWEAGFLRTSCSNERDEIMIRLRRIMI
jgi:hypothetical protein